jgi:hypothetical protein
LYHFLLIKQARFLCFSKILHFQQIPQTIGTNIYEKVFTYMHRDFDRSLCETGLIEQYQCSVCRSIQNVWGQAVKRKSTYIGETSSGGGSAEQPMESGACMLEKMLHIYEPKAPGL